MFRRSAEKGRAKNTQSMTQYYAVIGFFVVTMVVIVFYSIFDPKQGVGERLVIDEDLIMANNNDENNFKRSPNTLFSVSLFPCQLSLTAMTE